MAGIFATYQQLGNLPVLEIPQITDNTITTDKLDSLKQQREIDLYNKYLSNQQIPTIQNTDITSPSIKKINKSLSTSNTNLTFEQMLKKTGLDKYIRITSGFRDPSRHVGKYWKTSNHSKRAENGESYAYDIVPINGDFADMKRRIQNNPEMHNYLLAKGYRVLDETSKDVQRKTGASGAHFYLSHVPNSKEGVSYKSFIISSKNGGTINKFQTGGIFASYQQLENPPIIQLPESEQQINFYPELKTKDSLKRNVLPQLVRNHVQYTPKSSILTQKPPTTNKEFKNNKDFIQTMKPIISNELNKIGKGDYLNHVLAQIVLESGWGKKPSGKNNYAGLKASASQKGSIINTHEIKNGQRVAEVSKFIDFDSLEDFAKYYINKLNTKFHAFGGGDYTANIKRNKYFTEDENKYRNNINSIINSIKKVDS